MDVSALGLGCWQFSKGTGAVGRFWSTLSQDDIQKIIQTTVQGGINWFDTAEVYGKGQSEEALADALIKLGEEVEHTYIATKWWPLLRTASSITKTIDDRIAALKNHTIDLYQVHQPFSFSSVKAEMDAMAELVKANKVRHIGVSNFTANKMREADQQLQKHGLRLASNQVKYSLLDRRIETNGTLDAAKELGITIIAYSPLEQGILTGKFHRNPELIKNISGPRKYMSYLKPKGLEKSKPLIDLLFELAEEYGATPSQIALNWMINFHGETVVAIPGASKVKHAEENVGTLQFNLLDEHMNMIDKVSKKITQQ
ncbi:aldo/keto reductase [Bacillus sp. HMF5848]|uniref:aldo/keto reductase n=1 Tax=Bacillus sp. HMF5848 TaxID=2495421 RepID=UPI000F7B4F68|nr:aldo/keto reductase [Bacillus sp. HMF5848]RSK29273.1 aldo/keto reductase [Bacillus sp. HMF5848]